MVNRKNEQMLSKVEQIRQLETCNEYEMQIDATNKTQAAVTDNKWC